MLHHPTLEKLTTLKFTGMVKALTEQLVLFQFNSDRLTSQIQSSCGS